MDKVEYYDISRLTPGEKLRACYRRFVRQKGSEGYKLTAIKVNPATLGYEEISEFRGVPVVTDGEIEFGYFILEYE